MLGLTWLRGTSQHTAETRPAGPESPRGEPPNILKFVSEGSAHGGGVVCGGVPRPPRSGWCQRGARLAQESGRRPAATQGCVGPGSRRSEQAGGRRAHGRPANTPPCRRRIETWRRARCSSVQPYAVPCSDGNESRRHFLGSLRFPKPGVARSSRAGGARSIGSENAAPSYGCTVGLTRLRPCRFLPSRPR
jgi:hypothetical protein